MLKKLALYGMLGMVTVAHGQGMILVVDSGLDRVMALNPSTGAIITPNLISDPLRFQTPKEAIDSGRGTIFVSDQFMDAVYEYTYSGAYVGQVAGLSTSIPLDNCRGMALDSTYLYVTNAGSANGAPGNAIVRIRISDMTTTVFPTGAMSPYDILLRPTDMLVTDVDGDDIVSFSYSGANLGYFYNSDGVSNVDFPQQLAERPNGNVLTAGFSFPIGVFEYTASGTPVANYSIGTGNRGVYVMPDGRIMHAYAQWVDVFNPVNNQTQNVSFFTSASMQYINLAYGTDVPAASYVVVEGDEFAGDVNSIRSADSNTLQVFNDTLNLNCNIQFEGRTSVLNPTTYRVRGVTSADRLGLAEGLFAYNFTTNQWNSISGRSATSTLTSFDTTLTSNAGDYVDANGDVRVRLLWSPINDEDPAVDGWLHNVDQIYWTVE